MLFRTRFGYALRMTGSNPRFARFSRLRTKRSFVWALALSGAFAGAAAVLEVAGVHGRLITGFSNDLGWNGITVALIARLHPLGVVPAALLYGYLQVGANAAGLLSDVSPRVATVVQSVIFYLITAQALYVWFRRALGRRADRPGERGALGPGGGRARERPRRVRPPAPARRPQARRPLVVLALAGALTQRAGLVNIGLEGVLLAGAFAAVLGAGLTGSLVVGVACAALAGMFLALVFGWFSLYLRANLFIVGLATNAFSAAVTAYAAWLLSGQAGQLRFAGMPTLPRLALPGVAGFGPLAFLNGHTALDYLAWLLVPVVAHVLFRSRFGLRLRATGEDPAAARAAGLRVDALRYTAVAASGLLAGLAGAQLSLTLGGSCRTCRAVAAGWASWRPSSAAPRPGAPPAWRSSSVRQRGWRTRCSSPFEAWRRNSSSLSPTC